jgi:hypothetical protein
MAGRFCSCSDDLQEVFTSGKEEKRSQGANTVGFKECLRKTITVTCVHERFLIENTGLSYQSKDEFY